MTSYIEWVRSHTGPRQVLFAFASVILKDQAGRVLLQYRTDFKHWGLPGGSLERGEHILDCAHRELLEETGFISEALQLVGVYSGPEHALMYPNGDRVQQYTVCFQGRVKGGVMRVDGTEASDQAFFFPYEIPYPSMLPWYTAMLKDALLNNIPAFTPPHTIPCPTPQIAGLRRYIGSALCIGAGATAVVQDRSGRLLVAQRADTGEWSFPGGYSLLGENVAQTAVRETREETNITITPQRILGVYSSVRPWEYPNGDLVQPLVTIFLAQAIDGKPEADRHETLAVAWKSPGEILALPVNQQLKNIHQKIIEHLDDGYFILTDE